MRELRICEEEVKLLTLIMYNKFKMEKEYRIEVENLRKPEYNYKLGEGK